MMNTHVLIVIRLGRGRLPAYVTRERPNTAMHPHVVLQVVRPMELLIAHGTRVRLRFLVLLHVPLTIVLPDELCTAIITRVRSNALVCVHVRYVVALPYERPFALIALERLRSASSVRPLVQLQVPLGRKVLVADGTGERPLAGVALNVHIQRGLQIHPLANGTRHVLRHPLVLRNKVLVVSASHMPRQTSHVHKALAAVRTRLRLNIVRLLVPSELLLRMKHLPALTYVILHLLLNIQMVPIPVLHQIRMPPERLLAHITLDRRLPRMNILMLVVLLLRQERLLANVTLVRLNPQVPLHMQLDTLLPIKQFAAQATLERMHFQVLREFWFAIEHQLASVAFVTLPRH